MAVPDTLWREIAQSPFVSLATFRRDGTAVATPVWVARDGDELVVTTERKTGKVKRLRNDDRVTLRPCSRMGAVEPDAVVVEARGRIAGPSTDDRRADAALRRRVGAANQANHGGDGTTAAITDGIAGCTAGEGAHQRTGA